MIILKKKKGLKMDLDIKIGKVLGKAVASCLNTSWTTPWGNLPDTAWHKGRTQSHLIHA